MPSTEPYRPGSGSRLRNARRLPSGDQRKSLDAELAVGDLHGLAAGGRQHPELRGGLRLGAQEGDQGAVGREARLGVAEAAGEAAGLVAGIAGRLSSRPSPAGRACRDQRHPPELTHGGVGVEVGAGHGHDGPGAVRVDGGPGDGADQGEVGCLHGPDITLADMSETQQPDAPASAPRGLGRTAHPRADLVRPDADRGTGAADVRRRVPAAGCATASSRRRRSPRTSASTSTRWRRAA